MKTIEYRTIDKSTWGPGPWQDEPDKKQWRDEATGLPCMILRPNGTWCGYVGVSKGHPLYGDAREREDLLEVHGGITFAGMCSPGDESHEICHIVEDGEDDAVFWIGFDCNHAFDFCPERAAIFKGNSLHSHSPDDVYRTQQYVEDQCRSLALQLVEWGKS